MARNVKVNKISKVITYLLLLCIVVAFISFLAYSTENFSSSFKTFYVEYEGEKIKSNKEYIRLMPDKEEEFKVIYTLGFLADYDYIVKIVPNVTEETNFRIRVDDQYIWFNQINDFTNAFNIERMESSFVLKPQGYIDDILQSMYPNKSVEIPELIDYPYFKLLIASSDKSFGISIGLNFFIPITDIILDTTEVLFC